MNMMFGRAPDVEEVATALAHTRTAASNIERRKRITIELLRRDVVELLLELLLSTQEFSSN